MPCTDLNDFTVTASGGKLQLSFGAMISPAAREYLESYIARTHRYRSILSSGNQVRFSLYQPVMNSSAGKRSLEARLRRRFLRERIPQAVTIGVTAACQCTCAHCSADYHMDTAAPQLSTPQLCQAVEESVELGATTVILLGGEPLLRRDLEKIIQSADPGRAQTVLFTNGEFLTGRRCESLKQAGLQGIFVSVDSVRAEEHDNLRMRPGLFAALESGIQSAVEAGLLVAVSSYLTDERVQSGVFEQTMDFARGCGAHEVTFFDAIATGRLAGEKASFLSAGSRSKIAALTRQYRSMAEYPAVSPQSVLTSENGSSFCFAANTQFYLSSSGEFCPCDFTPLTIGRFPDRSIAALWQELTTSALYRKRSKLCRMQDPQFRARTIDRIPENAALPYPIQKLV